MPEDERPPAPAPLAGAAWLELLAAGAVEIEGRLPWSSNYSFLASLRLGEANGRAVYKPGPGERPLWDFPGGLYRREVAAYRLSEDLGLRLVPETVLRLDGPHGEGSLQRFVDADFSEHYFTLLERPECRSDLLRLAGFDLLLNNADRKGGHVLIDESGAVWGIDHGLCFHEEPKLRTVMWDFASEPVPDEILAACELLTDSVPRSLHGLLDNGEREALSDRARRTLRRPVFPPPRDDYRCYPWPLV